MKLLKDEQQTQLREFLNSIHDTGFPDMEAEAAFWATELKPKRIRKKGVDTAVDTQ